MTNFLTYIANQYGRKAEDVATDVVTYVLQWSIGKDALREVLAGLDYEHLPPRFSTVPRPRGDNGVPDIMLIDNQGSPRLIIESKFWAALTPKQPCAYFKCLPSKGLVLFVVPEQRQNGIWRELTQRCRTERRPITRTKNDCYIGETGEHYLAVISWKHLLNTLMAGDSEFSPLLDQLRRLCDVELQHRVEKLDATIISNKALARSVYDYMKLASQIADAAEDADCFTPAKRERKDACGESWSGTDGAIHDFKTWIGFDARLWSERTESPLWVQFEDKETLEELLVIFRAAAGKFPWLSDPDRFKDPNDGEYRKLVIPILLKPEVDYDALMRSATKQIEQLTGLLKPLP